MPRSIAERMVWTDSSRSVFPPHIQPPMAHVPKAMREAIRPDVPIPIVSIVVAARGSPPALSLASEGCALLPFGEISNAMKNSLIGRRPLGRVRQGWRVPMFECFDFPGSCFV